MQKGERREINVTYRCRVYIGVYVSVSVCNRISLEIKHCISKVVRTLILNPLVKVLETCGTVADITSHTSQGRRVVF